MRIHRQRLVSRLLSLLVLAIVIGITWFVYEDYVNTSSAQQLTDTPIENEVTEEDGSSTVQGVIEIAPKSEGNGILIVPAE
jgi:hypothetical protein